MAALISVIIPIYNVEKYLARCLDSVVNQTYKNLEIILVNDGTLDNSLAIAESYLVRDSRIKLLHQENAGVSEARNKGVSVATGDYIAFLDSDDWLELDAYEYLMALMTQKKADMVVAGLRRTKEIVDNSSSVPTEIKVLNQKEYAKLFFKIGSQSIHYYIWNALYRREVVQGVKQPKGFYGEDVLASFMYILNSDTIAVSNKVVYNYFINPEGQTAVFTEKHFDVLTVWDKVVSKAQESGDCDYQEWAVFNRKRANFSLLAEIALSDNLKQLKEKYKSRIRELTSSLRQDFIPLMAGAIPLNRKIMILLFVINYNLSSIFINSLRRFRKR